MTVINDNIKNIAGVPSGSSVWFSTDLRTTASGIVEEKRVEVVPNAQGNITADLTPGPAKVRFSGMLAGDLRITVPTDGPVTLRSLIAAALLIPPESPIELLQTAVELYLQENPIEGGGDLTKAVADQTYATLEAAAGLSQVVDGKLSKEVADTTYAPVLVDGKGLVRKGDLVYNVEDYGAIGDAEANDTAAVQAALDALPEHATLIFPKRYRIPGNVSVNKKFFTLNGPGSLIDGKLTVGTTGTRQDQFWNISGLTFERTTARPAGSVGIELLKTRRGSIQDCVFINMDKAIYVNPLPNAVEHDTAQIKIFKNEFISVNYAFYVDRDDAVTWMHTSDCKFLANTVNVAFIGHVWVKSIDGLVCKDNVFFFPSYNTTDQAAKVSKKNNIYIGQSDWLVISGNNCFESGEEAIVLDMAKHFTISDNLVAWPGQKGPFDAVRLTGANAPNGTITDNILSRFSGNAVGIHTTGNGTIVVKNNLCEYDATTGTYYGTPALNTFVHYGIFQAAASTDTVIESGNDTTGGIYNSRKNSVTSSVALNNDSSASASKAVVAVTAATPALVFTLNSHRFGQLTFSGLLQVEVKSSDVEAGNLSVYLFQVSKGPLGYYLTKISEQGLLTGGAANWPSFTFGIDDTNGKLRATPVGSTAGTFYFNATAMGNLRATAA